VKMKLDMGKYDNAIAIGKKQAAQITQLFYK
jgi:hypothetical protein